MTKQEFIQTVAEHIKKYAPMFNIRVCSPIIAQFCLESKYGTSNKVFDPVTKEWRHNYAGLKWRNNRCAVSNDYFEEWTSEQNKDGSYTNIVSKFCKFKSLEDCVLGYFQWTNIPNYSNLKGVTDPETYLKNIKQDKYATSKNYVENNMKVIREWNLTQYDPKGDDNMSYVMKQNIANKNNYGGLRNLSNIKFIVIHYTANDGDSDENNGKYFARNIVKASAHYFVDSDSVTQSVPDNYVAYSVGGKRQSSKGGKYYKVCNNTNSISIELCDDVKNGVVYPSEKTIKNAIELTKVLMKKYNISLDHVIRHFDVTGKYCPRYWTDDLKWQTEFKDKLSTPTTGTPTNTPTTPQNTFPFKVKVTADILNVRKGAGVKFEKTTYVKQNQIYTIVDTDGSWGKLKSGAGWINLNYTKRV